MAGATLRASDEDREAVASALRENVVAGRITMEEFEQRLNLVYSAVTLKDLEPLTADLPPEVEPVRQAEAETNRPKLKRNRGADRAVRQYSRALHRWQAKRDAQVQLLKIARDYRGESSPGFVCQAGEAVFASVSGTVLIEPRRQPGSYRGRSRGVSVPLGFGLRYRTGSSRGQYVQGAEVPAVIDTGTLFVTNKRVVFQGVKQTRECRFDKTLGVSQDPRTGTLVVSVSNRQKPLTVRYGRKNADWIAFRLELALAHHKGQVPAFIAQLESGLTEIERQKPVAPSQVAAEQGSNGRALRAHPGTGNAANSAWKSSLNLERRLKPRWVVVALVVLVLIVIGAVSGGGTSTKLSYHQWQTKSYADGVAWAKTDHSAWYSAPGCERRYMVTGADVSDPNDPSLQVPGANDPHDTYAEWRLGCRYVLGHTYHTTTITPTPAYTQTSLTTDNANASITSCSGDQVTGTLTAKSAGRGGAAAAFQVYVFLERGSTDAAGVAVATVKAEKGQTVTWTASVTPQATGAVRCSLDSVQYTYDGY